MPYPANTRGRLIGDLTKIGISKGNLRSQGRRELLLAQLMVLGQWVPVDQLEPVLMVETGKFLELEVASVPIYTSMKFMDRKMLHHLRENKLAGVHGPPLRTVPYEDDRNSEAFSSRQMA